MDKSLKLKEIRNKIKLGQPSIGSWMQISNTSVAEIFGDSNLDWVVIDREHGNFNDESLINIFQSLELGKCLPMVRLGDHSLLEAKKSLEAGAAGLIIPKIEDKNQLENIINECLYPIIGNRGIGFSRSNLYGKNFKSKLNKKERPLIVAMIESKKGVENLKDILKVKYLDGIFIGPYDLSSSIGVLGDFNSALYLKTISKIIKRCKSEKIPCGIHIIEPSKKELKLRIKQGYGIIAYSIDSVILRNSISI